MTERFQGTYVHLRPFTETDAALLYTYLNRDELIGRRYLPNKFSDTLPLSSQQATAIIESWGESEHQAAFAVVLNETDTVVGHTTIETWWDEYAPTVEMVIDPAHWGKGYGSDALGIVLNYLFKYTVAHSVAGWIAEWNDVGLGFAAKHGFQQGGTMRCVGLYDGKPYGSVSVDLLRPEWKDA